MKNILKYQKHIIYFLIISCLAISFLFSCQPSYALDRVATKYVNYTPHSIPFIISQKETRDFYNYLKYDNSIKSLLMESGIVGVGNKTPTYYGNSVVSISCFKSSYYCRSTQQDHYNDYVENIFLVDERGNKISLIIDDRVSNRKWYIGYTLKSMYNKPTNSRHTFEYIDMYGNKTIRTIEYENKY